ncbi:MAG TPA: tRNA-dihydrouridine synthase family protein [Candidatus Limnocylindria bacterium]|jgi:tRNA-dihydrouridine synthase|nr:tRNA-dihydrouridine synthase family protein [Candidatus Limnocylindria bacterium]
MDQPAQFDALLQRPEPLLALAPMQDVTDLPFWRLMARYGGPDVYWTEYFRVHATSRLEKWILESVIENPTGRPAIAQLIGNDIPSLVRAAKELQHYPIAAVDLNLGCPAPVVYRKCAGGGLLREPKRVDAILGAMREAIGDRGVKFTVKTRIGFDDPGVFDEFLAIFARHSLDLLTVHGRTVKEMYRTEVHYDFIARAAAAVPCPVLANGNVHSPARAAEVLASTGVRGLMIGRGCIRNPWLYEQIRQHQRGEAVRLPTGRELLAYIGELYEATQPPVSQERLHVEKMKKYLNFIGPGVGRDAGESAQFLHRIRRASERAEFFGICAEFLDHDRVMPLVPFSPDAAITPAGETCAIG